jgi:hypothetical protein
MTATIKSVVDLAKSLLDLLRFVRSFIAGNLQPAG